MIGMWLSGTLRYVNLVGCRRARVMSNAYRLRDVYAGFLLNLDSSPMSRILSNSDAPAWQRPVILSVMTVPAVRPYLGSALRR